MKQDISPMRIIYSFTSRVISGSFQINFCKKIEMKKESEKKCRIYKESVFLAYLRKKESA